MQRSSGRIKRAKKTRSLIARSSQANKHRLSIYRTPLHIYAQLMTSDGSKVITQASSVGKAIKQTIAYGGNVEAAKKIGELIAKKSIEKGITDVAFDRSGFKYHGRIKALADSAREHGLNF